MISLINWSDSIVIQNLFENKILRVDIIIYKTCTEANLGA